MPYDQALNSDGGHQRISPSPKAPNPEETETLDLPRPSPPTPELSDDLDLFLRHMVDAYPRIAKTREEAEVTEARYILEEELGRGSIGRVVSARDQHLSRYVAIKVLQEGHSVSRSSMARFIAEAQIMAQLEHPTIVPVHEIGRMPGGLPYFAMKKVKGASLDTILNHLRVGDSEYIRRYPLRRLLGVFVQVCQGIAYAHSRNVIHRDLKPANIMIGEYGEVQIMDWGLAKVMHRPSGEKEEETVRTVWGSSHLGTLYGSIAGTPSYMSPEQARGEIDSIGPASDIFSLGLILAEMLTLVRVFRNEDPRATIREVSRCSRPIELSELCPYGKFDRELEAIVRACTMPNPADRYPTADRLADDIRCYLENREISVTPDLHHQRMIKWTRRNPMLAGAVLAWTGVALLLSLWILATHLLR